MSAKRIIKWSIVFLIIAIILFSIYRSNNAQGKYNQFAKCLAEKGAVMYGTEWCPHCVKQKEIFGNSFKYINYKDCDYSKVLCDINNVTNYPTWIYNNQHFTGEQPLELLASITGCEIDKQ